ncbi:hypothetical protein AAIH46_13840 [Rhizobium sp. 0TCS1.26]|uniref:hypothetical protein n=1 Tax=Rhizobium sp. 0TCS1.26 TaxID=3142623 RepID=UPI003D27C07C
MLPPVASVTDILRGQSNQPQVVAATPRVLIGQPPAEARVPSDATALTPATDRLTILSVSGQMQLAQGLSVAAETVGAMMKIARRESEPLSDYAGRIAEAIAALSSAQRAALQRALNQLVKGLTIRLLAEILQNPAGPEATRLSLQLESRTARDRDLAARGVVSSYRQNDSSGMPAAIAARPPTLPSRLPSAAAGSVPAPTQVTAALSPVGASAAPEPRAASALSNTPADHTGDRAETARPAAPATTVSVETGESQSEAMRAGGKDGAAVAETVSPTVSGGRAIVRGLQAEAIAQQDVQGAEQPLKDDAASQAVADAGEAVAARARSLQGTTEEITYDAMALLRERALTSAATQAAATPGSSGMPSAARAAGGGLVAAILGTGWLAGAAADGPATVQMQAEGPPTSSSPPASAGSPIDGRAAMATPALVGMSESAGLAGEPASLAAEMEMSPPADPHAGTDISPAELQLAVVAQAVLLARAAPRDALVPVYVPYPPREEEEDEDEDRPSVSAVDRVDEDGSRGNNGRQSDQQADDNSDGHEEAESEAGAAEEGDAASRDAQQFYRRMTDW